MVRTTLAAGIKPAWPLLSRVSRIFFRDSAPRVRVPGLASAAGSGITPCKLVVLVVDDIPHSQRWLCEALVSLGISPLLAVDGSEAVALARERRLDLILMDIHMPVLDGPGATRKIRQHEAEASRRRVPVVAYTSIRAHGAHVRDGGMDGMLNKPCHPSELQACLAQWCARSAKHHEIGRHARANSTSPGLRRVRPALAAQALQRVQAVSV